MRNHNKMTAGKRLVSPPQQQRGVVLLLTLIVLVAMMLASIGMVRSIDTATQIAGNVAFRQTTLQAADGGVTQAISQLIAKVNTSTATKAELNNDYSSAAPALAFPGYMAHPFFDCEIDGTCNNPTAQQWWNPSVTFPVDNWAGAPTLLVNDANGNLVATVSYWVHRMCTVAFVGYGPNATPPTSPALCQTHEEAASGGGGGSHGSDAIKFKNYSVYYRITTRSVGPRNTAVYSQTLVLAPE